MGSADPSIGDLAFRVLGSLAVVVGLLLLIARGVNRRFKTPAGAAVQVVHRQTIGRGQSVTVVSVGTRVLVLGATEQQVTLLTEVEPDEVGIDLDELEAAQERVQERTAAGPRPVRALTAAFSGAQGPLAGSLLSAQTWRQTLAAFTQRQGPETSDSTPTSTADGAPDPLSDGTLHGGETSPEPTPLGPLEKAS